MKALQQRILEEGKALKGNIIKVDGFLNHRVDTKLLQEIAREFRKYFDLSGLTAVVTVEASGIPIGTICALEYGVPLVFAKKAKSDNISDGVYQRDIFSYTYRKSQTLILSKEWLGKEDKILIIDDFLARGSAMSGLLDIVEQSGAELIGIGVAVEKGFEGGGDMLRGKGYPLHSLARIQSAEPNGIVFYENEK